MTLGFFLTPSGDPRNWSAETSGLRLFVGVELRPCRYSIYAFGSPSLKAITPLLTGKKKSAVQSFFHCALL
jgi:hypothetical protein